MNEIDSQDDLEEKPTCCEYCGPSNCMQMSAAACPMHSEIPPTATLAIWDGLAPGALGTAAEDTPSIEVFLPSKNATEAAIIVCPGGGYHHRSRQEGEVVGRWLSAQGIAAFVLRYRVAPYRHPVPLLDAQRAVRFVRFHCATWRVSPERIGILGFSAGGHLSSTVSSHWNYNRYNHETDALDRVSARPNLQALIYPLITFAGVGSHPGCTRNLLGIDPDPNLLEMLSSHRHVTYLTPPTFLAHSTLDSVVPVINSDLYAAALERAGVGFKYIRGEIGGHGGDLSDRWTEPFLKFLNQHDFLRSAVTDPNE